MIEHSDLTIVAIHGKSDGSEMLPSLSHSVSQLKGSRGLLLSVKKPAQLGDEIEWAKIDQPFDYTGYSFFVLYFLHQYISTGHVLIVQQDSWVLNGKNFKPYFYDYDYIGVVCHAARVGDDYWQGYSWVGHPDAVPVYCGGFSLRTKKFLEALSLHKITPQNITHALFAYEDIQLGMFMRQQLEELGFKFAPMEIARQLGFEYLGMNLNYNDDLKSCLGHHAKTRLLTAKDQVLFRMAEGDVDKVYGERKVLELFQHYGYEINFSNKLPEHFQISGGEVINTLDLG